MKYMTSPRFYDLDHLDSKPGVYVLTFPDGIYIGSSKNLRARIRCWLSTRKPLGYTFMITSEYREAEDRLIRKARARNLPILNRNAALRKYHRHPRTRRRKPPLKGPKIRRWITIDGVRRPMSEWCREAGISVECALMRIRYGWAEREAVMTPKKK